MFRADLADIGSLLRLAPPRRSELCPQAAQHGSRLPHGSPDHPPETVGRRPRYRPRQPSQARRRRPLAFRAPSPGGSASAASWAARTVCSALSARARCSASSAWTVAAIVCFSASFSVSRRDLDPVGVRLARPAGISLGQCPPLTARPVVALRAVRRLRAASRSVRRGRA